MRNQVVTLVSISAVVFLGSVGAIASANPEATLTTLETRVADLKTEIAVQDQPIVSGTPTLGWPITFEFSALGEEQAWAIHDVIAKAPEVIPASNVTDQVKPRGRFHALYIVISNEGVAPEYPPESRYQLVDSEGRTFTYDHDATFGACLDDDECTADKMQPGLKYIDIIVFEVPEDAEIVRFQVETDDEIVPLAEPATK